MTQSVLLVVGAFLLGALPFSYWVARWRSGADLRTVGSRNPGATNVLRVAGKGPAMMALLLDIAKGFTPVAAAVELGEATWVVAATAIAAIMGHILSPFLGLRGGKGVATAVGALAVLNPVASGCGVVVFVALVLWKRYVSVGSIVGAAVIASVAVAAVDLGAAGWEGAFAAVVIAALVIGRHISNIKRLAARSEPRFGEKVSRT
jgi:glycerol-3-phosphate acyltransferase PlsY